MQRIFHTPEGVRDIYDGEVLKKRALQEKLHEVFLKYGCSDIETPSIEYFEVFSSEVGTIPSRELYKFFDREGNTLVLRPDFTPSVSRACATYFAPDKEPVSLCYTGNTFINTYGLRGKLKETTQMGVERIGDGSAFADAELLAMTVECLLASGLTEFQISVGQVDYFRSLLKESEADTETELRLRELISQKNYFGVEELVREAKIKHGISNALIELPQLFGGEEILKKAAALTNNARALQAVARLSKIYDLIRIYGYEKYISFDLSMLSKYHYYTGIIFQAYTYGTGEPVVKGGRYDDLMQHFGKSASSIGFAIVIDNLLLALQSQKIDLPAAEDIQEIVYTEDTVEEAIRKARKMRDSGMHVRLRKEEGGKPR